MTEMELAERGGQLVREAEGVNLVLSKLETLEVGRQTILSAGWLRRVAADLRVRPPADDVPDESIWTLTRAPEGWKAEEWK